jgi:beta-xylosidase
MTFARFLPGQDIVHGQLVKTESGSWAFSYEAGEDDDGQIVGLENHELVVGNYLTVLQDGRHEHVYRVTSVAERPV